MNPSDFDRLMARAQDPRLIPGIYNYCDSRCTRCPFNDRCLTYLETRDAESQLADRTGRIVRAESTLEVVGASLRQTIEMIAEAARREGIELAKLDDVARDESDDADFERHRQDPLAAQAREYGHLAWRITSALAPIVE